MKYSIISIDLQNDFYSPKGKWFNNRPCQEFIKNELIPFLKINDIKIAEIISDYRLPRPNEYEDYCIPGEWGYLSVIDESVKAGKIWIKAMNSPEWIREHGGEVQKKPGTPYQDPTAFSKWLKETIGDPEQSGEVVLVGLTMDCCVLCTAQQLYFRGYKVRILKEGTDVYSVETMNSLLPHLDYKDVLFSSTHSMWSKMIIWNELKEELKKTTYQDLKKIF